MLQLGKSMLSVESGIVRGVSMAPTTMHIGKRTGSCAKNTSVNIRLQLRIQHPSQVRSILLLRILVTDYSDSSEEV